MELWENGGGAPVRGQLGEIPKIPPTTSVVHPDPDPAGSEIICKSGSVINYGSGSDCGSGFESGSKLSSASN